MYAWPWRENRASFAKFREKKISLERMTNTIRSGDVVRSICAKPGESGERLVFDETSESTEVCRSRRNSSIN